MKNFSLKSAKVYGLWNEIQCTYYKLKAQWYGRKLRKGNLTTN